MLPATEEPTQAPWIRNMPLVQSGQSVSALVALGQIAHACERGVLADALGAWRRFCVAAGREEMAEAKPMHPAIPVKLGAEGFAHLQELALTVARNLDADDAELHWYLAARTFKQAEVNEARRVSLAQNISPEAMQLDLEARQDAIEVKLRELLKPLLTAELLKGTLDDSVDTDQYDVPQTDFPSAAASLREWLAQELASAIVIEGAK